MKKDNNCMLEILNILAWLNNKNKKGYCYPGQKTILEILQKRYMKKRALRSLNRYLKDMELNELIKRKRRIKKLNDGTMVFKSTLYVLSGKAYKILYKTGRALLEAGIRFTFGKKKYLQESLSRVDDQNKNEKYATREEAKEWIKKLSMQII
jgi:hypothetical protein